MSTVKVLLIAEEGDSRNVYAEELERLGVTFDVIDTPDDLIRRLRAKPYNGLLLDVPTMIRSKLKEKTRINEVLELYPVLRLLYNAQYGGVRGFSCGGTVRDSKPLGEFLHRDCAEFTPRPIRIDDRTETVFNVYLLQSPDQDPETGEKTITGNVSPGGCFVYSVQDWSSVDEAWVVFKDFDDSAPVRLAIRWSRVWGTSMQMPGFGASFAALDEALRSRIEEHI